MAAKVIFVNQNDKAQSFKVNLFGSGRNRVKVANVLAVFKASVAIMGDGSIMEADDDGLSMDTFNSGATYTITCLPQDIGQVIVSAKFPSWLESVQGDTDNTSNVDVIFSEQQAMHTVAEEPPVIMPLQTWGANPGEVRSIANPNINAPKEKRKGKKRGYAGLPIMVCDQGGLETVEPSSSHVGAIQAAQHSTGHHPHEVGDLVGFLQGPSGQGSGLSKGESPPPEGDSEEDVAGSTPCIDNGKASRGHTRCVKCGHSKNPSAKLQCTHCGAYLRDQTKARVAQRWAMLKEKAKREGRLGDKAWQRRKKYAFDKLTDLTLLDLENTYFALFISRRNREGDKFSYDGWYSEGAGKEFVTTGDVEAIWKSFVKKHHKRKLCIAHGCDVAGELEAGPS